MLFLTIDCYCQNPNAISNNAVMFYIALNLAWKSNKKNKERFATNSELYQVQFDFKLDIGFHKKEWERGTWYSRFESIFSHFVYYRLKKT